MKPLALVIENDAGTRKLLDVLLSRVGMDVDRVATGDDALVVLQHVTYDVLLLDLLLPGRNGMQLLEWLADERPHMLARVIVVSSVTPAHLDSVRIRWPQVHTIRKPFELGEVLELTQAVAAGHETHEQSAGEKFCRHSMRAGAKAGLVVATKGTAVEPLLAFGYAPETLEHYFPLALDAQYPLCTTVRDGRPLWIASVLSAAPDYPALAPVWEKNGSRALATIPLRDGDRIIGAAGWSFREPHLFSDAEQQVLTSIAESVPDWLRDEQSAAPAGT